MKLKKSKRDNFNLLFVQFLNFKNSANRKKYKSIKYFFNQFILQKIYFKSFLNIIFYYSLLNKKIIFLGNFYFYNKKLLQIFERTNHFFIPTFLYKNDFLTNKIVFYRFLKFNKFKNKKFALNLLTKNSFNLVIVLNKTVNFNIKTFFKLNIPVINFYANFKELFNIKFSNLFILFLNSILKKCSTRQFKKKSKNDKIYK